MGMFCTKADAVNPIKTKKKKETSNEDNHSDLDDEIQGKNFQNKSNKKLKLKGKNIDMEFKEDFAYNEKKIIIDLETLKVKPRRLEPLFKNEDNETGIKKSLSNSPVRTNENLNSEEIINNKAMHFKFEKKKSDEEIEYKIADAIGNGPHGFVYNCLNLNSGQMLACKRIKLEYLQCTLPILNQKLLHLNHTNIIKYKQFRINNAETIDILMEFVSGGSIKNLISKFGKFEEQVVSIFLRQILEGLVYLQSNGLFHRNLKTSNILAETDGIIKLSDIYMIPIDSTNNVENTLKEKTYSKENKSIVSFSDSHGSSSNETEQYLANNFNYNYAAPEILQKHIGLEAIYSDKSDVWSVGCVMLEMLKGKQVYNHFQSISEFDAINKILKGELPNFPDDITKNCLDFLNQTLNFSIENRSSFSQLIEHPFVKDSYIIDSNENLNESNLKSVKTITENSFENRSFTNKSILSNFLNHSIRKARKDKSNIYGSKFLKHFKILHSKNNSDCGENNLKKKTNSSPVEIRRNFDNPQQIKELEDLQEKKRKEWENALLEEIGGLHEEYEEKYIVTEEHNDKNILGNPDDKANSDNFDCLDDSIIG